MSTKTRAVILFIAGVILIAADIGQIYWAINSTMRWLSVFGMALGVFAFWCCWLNWQIWRRES